MTTEDESWRKQFASEGNGGGDRPQRPSFDRNNGGYQRERREYRSNDGYNREGGYHHREGGYQRENRDRRPGGDYNRGGYRQREGGYQSRPNNREGGYQRREGGYQQRPYNREGGYQQREGGFQQREGGYQQRPYNREGGYQHREGGYQSRPGGYKKRPQGYNPHAKYSMKKQIEYKEKNYDPDEPVRLNRYLANAGVCSRREADTFIQAGVVKVNGVVVTELGTKVKRSDEVMFHDQAINMEKKVYVLLNKPKDYVTTSDDPQNRKTVMELVKNACRERIYPVGRLDRNTTGVLLFTNDGDLATKLTHPQYLKKKIYHVFCDKNVTAADLRQIADGIMLEDGEIHADAIDYAHETDKKQVGIEIHSGRNRIVRRIFEHLGYKVVKLDRVYFAGLTKKNVKRGDWRFLTQDEVNMLKMGAFE
ncbi:MAG: pseudouridine synthase [Bacteroidaceae bacterium]|nr:RNA-binding S4 domain-containing protein [Bacteroidaceae bacterium]MEE1288933.1 pseudouridine synthase [Bacteroidaceae bacterium]